MDWQRVMVVMSVLVCCFVYATTAHAADWQVVYSTDFSSDPGWTTNTPSQMYWNSAREAYHLQLSDGHGQYTFVNIPYSPSLSYKLEFDLQVVRLDWAGMVSFGLGDPDMEPYKTTTWGTYYGRGDGGTGTIAQYHGDTAAGGFPAGYDCPFDLNIDYHNVMVYDRLADSLSWQVTRLFDGAIMADYSASGVGTFTGIDRLYSSRVGYCYCYGATGEGYIDNVVLSVPEPATLALLAVGLGALVVRKRRT